MSDLEIVRSALNGIPFSRATIQSTVDLLDELEAARAYIHAHDVYDKALQRYKGVISGASEETIGVDEVGAQLADASSRLEQLRELYEGVRSGSS